MAPLPVRAAQRSASGGEPGGHGPGVEVIASAAPKASDPVVAPVFATAEAAWTAAATASAVARTARATRRFVRFSYPVIRIAPHMRTLLESRRLGPRGQGRACRDGDRGARGERVRRALEAVPPVRVVVAPDCGMKCLPREL